MTEEKAPRVVIGQVMVTLDGRGIPVTAPERATYQDALVEVLGELPSHATAVVFGRENYLAAQEEWTAVLNDPSADSRTKAFAEWIERIRKIVRSTSLAEEDLAWNNSRLSDPDPAAEIVRLRPQQIGGNVLVLDSVTMIRALLEANEIDRLHLTVVPEVAGDGDRLFDGALPTSSWTLRESHVGGSSAVTLVYDRVAA